MSSPLSSLGGCSQLSSESVRRQVAAPVILRLLNLLAVVVTAYWLGQDRSAQALAATLVATGSMVSLEAVTQSRRKTWDHALYRKFLRDFPSRPTIHMLRDWSPTAPFRVDQFEPLRQFFMGWNDAEHEFGTRSLDRLRRRLADRCEDFLGVLNPHSYPTGDHWTITPGMEQVDPERYRIVVARLETLRQEIVDLHQEFIRIGRIKFPDTEDSSHAMEPVA